MKDVNGDGSADERKTVFSGFGDSFSDLSNTVASASTAPGSSSGGGGGGSSGGGGGGGGGSDW